MSIQAVGINHTQASVWQSTCQGEASAASPPRAVEARRGGGKGSGSEEMKLANSSLLAKVKGRFQAEKQGLTGGNL